MGEAFDRAWCVVKESPDYQGHHAAPIDSDYHSPLHDLDEMMPDVHVNPHWYGHPREDGYHESVAAIRQARGKPNAKITIYRAVPRGVQNEINPGDWVTPSRAYAEGHGLRFDEGCDILTHEVEAKDLFSEGNSIHEYGWRGHT